MQITELFLGIRGIIPHFSKIFVLGFPRKWYNDEVPYVMGTPNLFSRYEKAFYDEPVFLFQTSGGVLSAVLPNKTPPKNVLKKIKIKSLMRKANLLGFQDQAFLMASSRKSRFNTLPAAFNGNDSTKYTLAGTLYGAIFSRQKFRTSTGVRLAFSSGMI
jgi:hypothetical protein